MNRTFIDPAVLAEADPTALESLLAEADWNAFVPERDLPALRDRLTALEREHGVTRAHRLATDGVRARGTTLSHPAVHVSEITAVALSPSGSHLATGEWGAGDRGIVQIWEVATGRCVNALPWIDGGVGMSGEARAVQWSADGRHLGMAFRTNAVGVWDPFGGSSERHAFEESEPRAEAQVTDGANRPPSWALHPDGRSAYVASGRSGGPGVYGCIPPLDSGVIYWRHDEAEAEPEWVLARRPLPPEIQEAIGEELEIDRSPTWSADGPRLYVANRSEASVVDMTTGDPLWIVRVDWLAEWSPDQRFLVHLDRRTLQFRDATDGRLISEPVPTAGSRFDMSLHSGLRGSAARFAVVRSYESAAPGVEIYDDGRLTYQLAVTPAKTPDISDFATWAWSPNGDRGAVLTASGEVEIWSLDGEPRHQRSLPAPDGTRGVLWGAADVVVATGKDTLRFWRVDLGEAVGDYDLLREARAELPIHGDFVYDHFDGSIVALDGDTWCLPVEPDMAIAPPDRRADVEAHLAWVVDRRFAWPLRWGQFGIWPDAPTALAKARTMSPDVRVLREAVREMVG